jgi:3'-phosphoadenosine 5'-phosphosulfate sulfotransferase (PAPS reductase)/FAD synthetase
MNDNLNWKIEESKRVIEFALNKWGKNCGVAFTGRKDSTVLVSLIKDVTKNVPTVMFIDHGRHFPVSIAHLKKVIGEWNLNVYWVKDEKAVKEIRGAKGKKKRQLMDRYKIESINKCLKENNWKALFTAIRADEQPARGEEIYFSERLDHYRIHPLLHWTEEDIWEYIREKNISYNPLYDMGYRSLEEIGTKKVKNVKKGERSGRSAEKEQIMGRLRKLGYF